jgi:excisionase family DNA binding protein
MERGGTSMTTPTIYATDLTGEPTAFLLTVEEAAARLRIGRTSMYRLIKDGEIESIPVGRLRRVAPEALVDYINRLRSAIRNTNPAA